MPVLVDSGPRVEVVGITANKNRFDFVEPLLSKPLHYILQAMQSQSCLYSYMPKNDSSFNMIRCPYAVFVLRSVICF